MNKIPLSHLHWITLIQRATQRRQTLRETSAVVVDVDDDAAAAVINLGRARHFATKANAWVLQ